MTFYKIKRTVPFDFYSVTALNTLEYGILTTLKLFDTVAEHF